MGTIVRNYLNQYVAAYLVLLYLQILPTESVVLVQLTRGTINIGKGPLSTLVLELDWNTRVVFFFTATDSN
jgi:hypothetical protein